MKYFIGLDNGGTMTKAALFDQNGAQIYACGVRTETLGDGGIVERDLQELRNTNLSLLARVVKESGVDVCAIAGVAGTGHGKGLYMLDKRGKPLYRGIVSTDSRAARFEAVFKSDGTAERVRPLTHQQVLACQPVCLLPWLKANRPEIYAEIGTVFSVKDYVRFCLCGEVNGEYTDMSGTNLLDLNTRSYSKELLQEFGIPEIFDALPPLIKSFDVAGTITPEVAELTGLRPDTVVVGGMFDIDACALALGMTDGNKLCMIAGTWSINEFLSAAPVDNGVVKMNSLYCLPSFYLSEECSATSAGNYEWYLTEFLREKAAELKARCESVYAYCDGLVSEAPIDSGLMFLPYLYGSADNVDARAAFFGYAPEYGRAHTLRAIMEGVVFSSLLHVDRLKSACGDKTLEIRLGGGVTNSAVWSQMFCDCLGKPVQTVGAKELGALGCAIACATACRVYKSLAAAAKAMSPLGARYEPDMQKHTIYKKKYQNFCKATDLINGFYEK